MRDHRLVHPTDRVLTRSLLRGGACGQPDIQTREGRADVPSIDGLRIDWRAAGAGAPAPAMPYHSQSIPAVFRRRDHG